jgi:RimJ/RimL family protein N-acetyltransferase
MTSHAHAIRAIRIAPDLRLAAARRLVSQEAGDADAAARRLLHSGPHFGIDFDLLWGTVSADRQVRQVCLAVLGSGRTAMLFLSEPAPGPKETGELAAERIDCIRAAASELHARFSERVQVVQALPDPRETFAIAAYEGAGLQTVGRLIYLRRPSGDWNNRDLDLPAEIRVTRVSEMAPDASQAMLIQALEASYVDTQDCPELCGWRATTDVLESHRSTGEYDPSLWWIVSDGSGPGGCILLNRCPEQRSIELVYIGLAPRLRGRGLSSKLLRKGAIEASRRHSSWPVTCAVDERNSAARRLYDSLGFAAFGSRIAYVGKPAHVGSAHAM